MTSQLHIKTYTQHIHNYSTYYEQPTKVLLETRDYAPVTILMFLLVYLCTSYSHYVPVSILVHVHFAGGRHKCVVGLDAATCENSLLMILVGLSACQLPL